eukprot:TRINITY_DN10132_c0_g1_i1.p1 TRINITY_DN10132_c0_g1~~TRINITY_DN10132_c0_g1_i1.p1  ORF type:complete len:194 (+),score=50.24 TRINITY_DN10132_c0_g1_i1:120-701(+)
MNQFNCNFYPSGTFNPFLDGRSHLAFSSFSDLLKGEEIFSPPERCSIQVTAPFGSSPVHPLVSPSTLSKSNTNPFTVHSKVSSSSILSLGLSPNSTEEPDISIQIDPRTDEKLKRLPQKKKRRDRFVWSQELHSQFEVAVESLGESATARKVLDLMENRGVDTSTLNRVRVANHMHHWTNLKNKHIIEGKKVL